MAQVTKTEHLKQATCSPGDGVAVNSTKMLRGQPSATTDAWSDTNETKQHVANSAKNSQGGGGMNDLKA